MEPLRSLNPMTRRAAGLLVIGGALSAVVLVATAPAPVVGVDGAEYLAVADNVAGGDGLTMPYVSYDEPFPEHLARVNEVPLTQFPPLYPVSIAAVMRATGAGAITASRWVGATLVLVTFVLAGALLAAAAPRGTWLALAALVLAPPLFGVSIAALTEMLALATASGAALALVRYLVEPSRGRLVALAAAAALPPMVRYAGVAVPLAAGVCVLTRSQRPLRRRVLAALAVTGGAVAPLLVWLARNVAVLGRPSERPVAWHPPNASDAHRLLLTLGGWVTASEPLQAAAGVLVMAGAVAVGMRFALRRRGRADGPAATVGNVCVWFAVASAFVVLAAKTFVDANIRLDQRQFVQAQFFAVLAVIVTIGTRPRRRATAVAAVGGGAVLVVAAMTTLGDVRSLNATDTGSYTSRSWRQSPTLKYVRSLPRDTLILTNAPDPVWLHTRRRPILLPLPFNPYVRAPNGRYAAEMADVARVASLGPSVVVFFDRPTSVFVRRIRPEVVGELQLTELRSLPDSTVYGVGATDGAEDAR